jgi:hypothetical protein
MISEDLEIKPLNITEYTCKQSKSKHVMKIPFRQMVLGSSGMGKTNNIIHQITNKNFYRNCFSRIFVFSPSINIDKSWDILKDYQKSILHADDDENLYFEDYNEQDLQNIIDTQYKIITHLKDVLKKKVMFSILIVIDDHADNGNMVHNNNNILSSLFIRGRHNFISCIISSQKYVAVANIIRCNLSAIIIFRLKTLAELTMVLNEFSALIDKKLLLEIYNKCTAEKFNFLYININAPNIHEMFYKNFTHKIEIENM